MQTNSEITDTSEDEINDEEVVDTMGYDILEAMEWKMLRYVMTLILAVGRKIKWMMKLNICLIPLKKIQEINYKYVSLKQTMSKNILWRVIMFLFLREGVREGGYSKQKEDD